SSEEVSVEESPGVETGHRAGFVALAGLPNAGKSSLLNAVLGRKLSIATPKPQTTRNRILGIENRPGVQYLFVDTPGLHRGRNLLGERMEQAAVGAIADADVVAWVLDASREEPWAEAAIAARLAASGRPVVVALNKIDQVDRTRLFARAQRVSELLPGRHAVPVSARTGENLPELLETIRRALPESPPLYPEEAWTDLPERFFAAELVREQLLLATHEEVPYGSAVVIDSFEEREGRNLVAIEATILVARDSHKGIVIGRGGQRLKEIGRRARIELERFLDTRVWLGLRVKVDPDWFASGGRLAELGL
ncbi:MAG: GTPase Era, partial [Alphaproteobacteria bacterium]